MANRNTTQRTKNATQRTKNTTQRTSKNTTQTKLMMSTLSDDEDFEQS